MRWKQSPESSFVVNSGMSFALESISALLRGRISTELPNAASTGGGSTVAVLQNCAHGVLMLSWWLRRGLLLISWWLSLRDLLVVSILGPAPSRLLVVSPGPRVILAPGGRGVVGVWDLPASGSRNKGPPHPSGPSDNYSIVYHPSGFLPNALVNSKSSYRSRSSAGRCQGMLAIAPDPRCGEVSGSKGPATSA